MLRQPAPPTLAFAPTDWITTWKGDAESVSLSPQTNGTLEITISGQPALTGKGAVLTVSTPGCKLTPRSRLLLRVASPDGDMDMAVALRTDQFYESPVLHIAGGASRDFVVDASTNQFKSARTQWAYRDTVDRTAPLEVVEIVLYPVAGQTRRLVLHSVELSGADLPPSLAPRRIRRLELIRTEPLQQVVPRYGKFELAALVTTACSNPFDPSQITLDAEFVSPSGRTSVCPGFVYALAKAPGDPDTWRVRFSPDEPGTWRWTVKAAAPRRVVASQPAEIQCVTSEDPGPIRVSRSNPLCFEHADGSAFYPIGHNVCWNSLKEYQDQFARMQAHGENWSRVWIAPWNCEIEWSRRAHPGLGLGWYYLDHAQKLDGIVEAAEQAGLYVQLVLHEHCRVSAKTNPEWQNNPYNKALGGPCATPQEFFTNEEARRLARNRLRYIVARWGYSSHIMAWELFNEADLADDFNFDTDAAWHKEMAGYIRAVDPHRRMITTSYISQPNVATYRLPEIDYAQSHVYVPDIVSYFVYLHPMYASLGKPYFIGEFGRNATDGVDAKDTGGKVLHAGIWAQLMVPSAGNAMSWWWYDHIDPHNLYPQFAALARFADGLDRRTAAWSLQTGRFAPQTGPAGRVIAAVSPSEIRLWLYDPEVLPWKEGPVQDRGRFQGMLMITNGGMGDWEIQQWDTYKGETTAVWTNEAANGVLTVPVSAPGPDVAFILRRVSEASSTQSPQLVLDPWDPRLPSGVERFRWAIARAPAPVTIDAKLDEWAGAEELSAAPRDGRSPFDNCFAFSASHDDSNLYVAVRVTDDQLVRREAAGSNLWKDDGVEIWVDSRNDADFFNNMPHNPGCYQVNIAPSPTPGGRPDIVVYRNPKWNERVFPGIGAASSLTTNGYVIEAVIPVAAMRGRPLATNVIGFNVSTCDADLRNGTNVWGHLLWQGQNEWNAMEWSTATLKL